jgi:hypothetical protein
MTRLAGGPSAGGPGGGFGVGGLDSGGLDSAGLGGGSQDDGAFGGDGPAGGTPLPTRQPGSSQVGGPGGGPSMFRPVAGAGNGNRAEPGSRGENSGNGNRGGDLGSTAQLPAYDDSAFSDDAFGDASGVGPGPASTVGGAGRSSVVSGSDGSSVTVPPSVNPGQEQRLPIFDSLESDWFRRSGKSVSSGSAAAQAAPAAGSQSWNSPADEGWRAAQVAASPNADETTMAGLPKRVPRANLVPGSVGAGEETTTEAAPPVRSADSVRDRMASFQRGVREARAAAPQIEEP